MNASDSHRTPESRARAAGSCAHAPGSRAYASGSCARTRGVVAIAAIALGVASALAAAPAGAEDKPVALKLATWLPAQHPLNPALQAWAEDIRKASQGSITSTLFPSEQLGKAFDHYDMARDAIADFAYVNPGYQPGRFPIFAAASLPFLFADAKGGSAAIDAWY